MVSSDGFHRKKNEVACAMIKISTHCTISLYENVAWILKKRNACYNL